MVHQKPFALSSSFTMLLTDAIYDTANRWERHLHENSTFDSSAKSAVILKRTVEFSMHIDFYEITAHGFITTIEIYRSGPEFVRSFTAFCLSLKLITNRIIGCAGTCSTQTSSSKS